MTENATLSWKSWGRFKNKISLIRWEHHRKNPFSADMEKRYKLTAVKIDKFHDDEIITFRNVAAKFLKGWGRAEIRSGKIKKKIWVRKIEIILTHFIIH